MKKLLLLLIILSVLIQSTGISYLCPAALAERGCLPAGLPAVRHGRQALRPTSLENSERKLQGPKGFGLQELKQFEEKYGYCVPDFGVLNTEFFDMLTADPQLFHMADAIFHAGRKVARDYFYAQVEAESPRERDECLARIMENEETKILLGAYFFLQQYEPFESFLHDKFGVTFDVRVRSIFKDTIPIYLKILRAKGMEAAERRFLDRQEAQSLAYRDMDPNGLVSSVVEYFIAIRMGLGNACAQLKVKGNVIGRSSVWAPDGGEDSFLSSLAGYYDSETERIFTMYRKFLEKRRSVEEKLAIPLQGYIPDLDAGGVIFSSLGAY
ncbi:hypothetical protein ACFL0T_07955 [Candidatus Omnitrophota bacterium]